MRKVPIGQDVNPSIIARGTPGMSGADLANLCNEAALMAARRNARVVEMQDFEKAKDVNPSIIARGTPGMSGADLANLCNEAALMAARRNARVVEMQDFEKAK